MYDGEFDCFDDFTQLVMRRAERKESPASYGDDADALGGRFIGLVHGHQTSNILVKG